MQLLPNWTPHPQHLTPSCAEQKINPFPCATSACVAVPETVWCFAFHSAPPGTPSPGHGAGCAACPAAHRAAPTCSYLQERGQVLCLRDCGHKGSCRGAAPSQASGQRMSATTRWWGTERGAHPRSLCSALWDQPPSQALEVAWSLLLGMTSAATCSELTCSCSPSSAPSRDTRVMLLPAPEGAERLVLLALIEKLSLPHSHHQHRANRDKPVPLVVRTGRDGQAWAGDRGVYTGAGCWLSRSLPGPTAAVSPWHTHTYLPSTVCSSPGTLVQQSRRDRPSTTLPYLPGAELQGLYPNTGSCAHTEAAGS